MFICTYVNISRIFVLNFKSYPSLTIQILALSYSFIVGYMLSEYLRFPYSFSWQKIIIVNILALNYMPGTYFRLSVK